MHGIDIDGGASGSGLDPLHHDPTQGPGTSAWQQAQQMSLKLNAQKRRN